MKRALLFPGQGSQTVGMGKDIYEKNKKARALLDTACDLLNMDLKKIMFNGPEATLEKTQYTQLAVYVCSSMYFEIIREEDISFDLVAGHSLGEYNALLSAGVFSFEDGLILVKSRGEAMAKQNGKGKMAAVIGLTEEQLSEVLCSIGTEVKIANLNAPQQIVISGTVEGIEETGKKISGIEDASIRILHVSAPFHCAMMEEAGEIMRHRIEAIQFYEPRVPVVQNVSAKACTDTDSIRKNLINQITGQVRWYESIYKMRDEGVTEFLEVGNGNVLRRLNRAILPTCKTRSVII